MALVAFILLCVAVMLCGALTSKPIGWVAVALAVLALLMYVVPTALHR